MPEVGLVAAYARVLAIRDSLLNGIPGYGCCYVTIDFQTSVRTNTSIKEQFSHRAHVYWGVKPLTYTIYFMVGGLYVGAVAGCQSVDHCYGRCRPLVSLVNTSPRHDTSPTGTSSSAGSRFP